MMCLWLMRITDAGEYNLTILTSKRHIIQLLQLIYSKVVENSRILEMGEPLDSYRQYVERFDHNPELFTYMKNGKFNFSSAYAAKKAKQRGANLVSCLPCNEQHVISHIESSPIRILLSDSTMHDCWKDKSVRSAGLLDQK